MAQCCPSSGGIGAHAMTGLGDSNPKAANLAIDPSLAIYELHRDGVTYLQINDVTGVVRAVVASGQRPLDVANGQGCRARRVAFSKQDFCKHALK